MSSVGVADEVCASCGKAEVDEVKLKLCTACNLVKYCSVDCQKNHRPQHKRECRKRAAEIRDDNLFKQPDEGHLGECQICCLPLPLDPSKFWVASCCCKHLCIGCEYANQLRELNEGLEPRCPFCREPLPETDEEIHQNYMERIKVNDPIALFKMGAQRYNEEDHVGAFGYYTKAAELGEIDAHYQLASMYDKGIGVDKDEKKEIYHLEEAAIGGHAGARFNLGAYEGNRGRFDRAMKHYIIAAKLGDDEALEEVKKYFLKGLASKEDYAAALRVHQATVDATKSKQREEAESRRAEDST